MNPFSQIPPDRFSVIVCGLWTHFIMYSVVRQTSQVSAGADGCRPEMANTQTATDRESGEERLQNGVMNVREERRLWHGWVVWEMREWFDSREQDVPIRWIYFPRTDRRLRRLRITHSLHPLFSGHNRAKLHSTYESFIIPELKQAAANCLPPPWLCTCACACSVPVPFRTVPGTDVVLQQRQLLNQQIMKSTVALSF